MRQPECRAGRWQATDSAEVMHAELEEKKQAVQGELDRVTMPLSCSEALVVRFQIQGSSQAMTNDWCRASRCSTSCCRSSPR